MEFQELDSPPIYIVSSTDSPEFTKLKSSLTRSSLVGLDAEWKPVRKRQSTFPQITLLQIGCRVDSDSVVFLLDLLAIPLVSIHELLKQVFESPRVLKLGLGFKQDLMYLSSTFVAERSDLAFDKAEPYIDIVRMCNALQYKRTGMWSKGLAVMCKDVLNVSLSKEQQCSDWSRRPLTEEQIRYAAADAYFLLKIFDALRCKFCKEEMVQATSTEFPCEVIKDSDLSWPSLSHQATDDTILQIVRSYGNKIVLTVADRKPKALKRMGKRQTSRELKNKQNGLKDIKEWEGPPPWDLSLGGDGCPKFLCDKSIEGLAKQLRCVGIDVAVPCTERRDARTLIEQAKKEKRVFLTQKGKLLRHDYPMKNQIYRLKNLSRKDLLCEVIGTFQLNISEDRLMSRCTKCNRRFIQRPLLIKKATHVDKGFQVIPYCLFNKNVELWECKDCNHFYLENQNITAMGVAFYNLSSEAGLKKLEEYLLSRSYISGYQASEDDLAVHAAVAKPLSSNHVNVSRWYNHIEALLTMSSVFAEGCGVTVEGSEVATPPVAYTKASAADDVDLFGQETKEEKKATEERAAAVKASGKKKEYYGASDRPRSSPVEVAAAYYDRTVTSESSAVKGGITNTSRRDENQQVEDGFKPNLNSWKGGYTQQFMNTNVPLLQHFDAWRGPPINSPAEIWNRGPAGGPPYGLPIAAGGFPLEPFPYYRPQISPLSLGISQAVSQQVPVNDPRSHHPKNGDMCRPWIPDTYMHPGMPVRPEFYPSPLPYSNYYGAQMGYNPNAQNIPFLGMSAARPVKTSEIVEQTADPQTSPLKVDSVGAADVDVKTVPRSDDRKQTSYKKTVVRELSATQRKRSTKPGKTKNKLEYPLPGPDSQSQVSKQPDPDKAFPQSGKTKASQSEVDAGSVQAVKEDIKQLSLQDSLFSDESHVKVNNHRKSQPRRISRNAQANKVADRAHGNHSTIWAPVRSYHRVEGADEARRKLAPDSIAVTTQNDNLGQNSVKSRRAETKRYIPKKVAKELIQQGTIQHSLPSSAGQTTLNETAGRRESCFQESYQPAVLENVGHAVDSNIGHARQSKHEKGRGGRKYRGSKDSSRLHMGSSWNSSKYIHKSVDQQQESLIHEPIVSDAWDPSDGWNMPEEPIVAVNASFGMKDQGAVKGKGKRQPYKGYQVDGK